MDLSEIYDFALSKWGTPYQWGGEGPDKPGHFGYDCSGYIRSILSYAGLGPSFDTTAEGLYLYYKAHGLDVSSPGKGCLVFFASSSLGKISHVGWMIDSKVLISAAGGNRFCTTEAYSRQLGAEVKIQPLTYYRSPVGFLLPKY
jgi:cell wall-associated NlpC family hydrolase